MTDQTPAPVGGPAPLSDAETRQWAGFAHLGGILGVLPSLIIWLVFRERSSFVDQEAKKALNFQIMVTIGYVALQIAGAIVGWPLQALFSLGVLVLWVFSLIFSIQGYQAIQRATAFKYPYSLDLIK